MEDQKLKRLKRIELLEILVSLSEENEALKKEISVLQSRLEEKTICISNAGSIAEASLQINKVFEAAQAAADQYLENIKNGVGAEPTIEDSEQSPANGSLEDGGEAPSAEVHEA